MAAAKIAGRAPKDIAEDVVSIIAAEDIIESASIAGPGFINLNLTDRALSEWANRLSIDKHLGFPVVDEPEVVVVDYAGPNVAKAMHIGHIRATIIGDSLARLFAFAGHKVIRDPHFGDWGFQMGLLIAAIEEENPDLAYFDPNASEFPSQSPVSLEDLQRIYPDASNRARADEAFAQLARGKTVGLQQGNPGYRALWSQMKTVSEASQREDFAALGVTFDLWYGESDVRDRVEPLVSRLKADGIAEESEGALVVTVHEETDNREIPPLILESSAGGFLYSTTDLATLEMRVAELDAELILYVVDRRQADHFTQVFRAARKAGIVPEGVQLEHIGFGTMNAPDGKPFRTREGNVVQLADLIELVVTAAKQRLDEAHLAEEYDDRERMQIAKQVGVAALKYGDLINNRASDYIFDLERFSSFEGKTGPYLQYAAVRIKSILRKADELGVTPGTITLPLVTDEERDLILELTKIPEVVSRSIDLRAPNHVAEYANSLAGKFNRFYDACHILSEPDPDRQQSLLAIAAWALSALKQLLFLLGIEVPERM
jgi:arginyl-tRNA synthetase